MKNVITALMIVVLSPSMFSSPGDSPIKLSKSHIDMLEGNQARYFLDYSGAKCRWVTVAISFEGIPPNLIEFRVSRVEDPNLVLVEGERADKLVETIRDISKIYNIVIDTGKENEDSECPQSQPNTSDQILATESRRKKGNISIEFNVADDDQYAGIKTFKIIHKIKNIFVGDIAVAVKDDDEHIVCASLYNLPSDCFDVHIGVRGTFDAEGSLDTEPYYLFLARSRITENWFGGFEAEYYKIPEFEISSGDDSSGDDENSKTESTDIFKISLAAQYDLPGNFMTMIKIGARNAPDAFEERSDVTKFYAIGIEHHSFFGAQKGRGVAGIAYAKDDYWNVSQGDAEEDLDERIILYGKVALDQGGAILLTTYMDFNVNDKGASEVGIALTYGGKWAELLKMF